MSAADFADIVAINSFNVSANIGADWWGRDRHQPICVSVYLHLKHLYLEKAGESDDVRDSVHYGHLCKTLDKLVDPPEANFKGLDGLAAAVTKAAFQLAGDAIEQVRVVLVAPKLCLMADGLGLEILSSRAGPIESKVFVKALTLAAIIGVNPPERETKQKVLFDISFMRENKPSVAEVDYISLISQLSKVDSEYCSIKTHQ